MYFLVVTAQWNFIHSFLSSIPLNVTEFISKFLIVFEKHAFFRGRDLNFFLPQVQLHCTYIYLLSSNHSWKYFDEQLLHINISRWHWTYFVIPNIFSKCPLFSVREIYYIKKNLFFSLFQMILIVWNAEQNNQKTHGTFFENILFLPKKILFGTK